MMVNNELPAGRVTELERSAEGVEAPSRPDLANDAMTTSGPGSLRDDPNVRLAGAVVACVALATAIAWASGASMPDFFISLGYLSVILPLFYGACAFVQLTVTRPKTRYVVIGTFATFAFLVALIGIFNRILPGTTENQRRDALLLLVIAGTTIVPMFKRVRLLLARLTPIDPNSTVDISGVIVAFWFASLSIYTLLTVSLEEAAAQANITVSLSIITVLAYPALAFSLVGPWITRSARESIKRLGLELPTLRQVGISLGLVVPLLIFGIGIDAIGRTLQPDLYEKLEQVVKAMSSNVTNPFIALVLAFSAGIGEEILFRGAIQPRLGIWFTALLFAVAHTQYGLTFGILSIFLIGIVLGYQRKYMNTTACIITHGAYNTVAFLLPLLSQSGG
jgi:uncharacterized protein